MARREDHPHPWGAPSWSDGLAREQQTGLLPLTTVPLPSMCDDKQLSEV